MPTQARMPSSLNYLGLLGPKGTDFGQFVFHQEDFQLEARQYMDFFFKLAGDGASSRDGPAIDVQVIETDGEGEQLDISLVQVPKNATKDPEVRARSTRYQDEWEDGVAYESLASSDIHRNTMYRVRIKNRDSSARAKAGLKIVVTEQSSSEYTGHSQPVLPESFSEVVRVKPKIPGLKEAAFLQRSRTVMETFKVSSLQPYIPKS